MAENILDRSNSMLQLFVREVEIDQQLPKWKLVRYMENHSSDKELKAVKNWLARVRNEEFDEDEDLDDLIIMDPEPENDGIDDEIEVTSTPDGSLSGYIITEKEHDEMQKKLDNMSVSIREFDGLNTEDFNLIVSKRMISKEFRKYGMSTNTFLAFDTPSNVTSADSKADSSFVERVTQIFRRWAGQSRYQKEEAMEFDAIQFFDAMKTLLKSETITYANRVKPYIVALKQAHDMGQESLAQNLISSMFINKYESILYAGGIRHKVTEDQVVNFVKKAEKGVRLDYIKNFVRPLPEAAVAAKKSADKLLVFDNYVILHFDPELKSFAETLAEQEKKRQKKADPIMFGVISGSKDLYYITDWIDDYCDLTLDKFVEVAGLEDKDISIDEKIKLT
jgi:hypothetical protein